MDRTRVYWLLPGMDRRIGFAETVNGTTSFYYYFTDQVGTVLRIVKEDGTVVNQYDYDAFGRVRWASANTFATVENRYLFQGREWDKNGGFYYFRNRIYLPERGEFSSPDMNLGRGILGELDGMATLTFCGGDPVNCVDPTGLWAWDNDWVQPIFMGSTWTGSAMTAGRLVNRTGSKIVQGVLVLGDIAAYSASSAWGYGDSFQGSSDIFKEIYANPSSFGSPEELRNRILDDTAKSVVNVGTLGTYGMYEGVKNAVNTGNFESMQDAGVEMLLINLNARRMEAKGKNPWTGAKRLESAIEPVVNSTPSPAVRSYKSLSRMDDGQLLRPNLNKNNALNLTEWRRSIRKVDIKVERIKFVGDDAVKIDAGTWRSLDGTRQFRTVPGDYFGEHGIGNPLVYDTPHVHFEFLAPPTTGGQNLRLIKNIHVPLVD